MSLTNTPEIQVNGKTISAANIDTEIQYHPAPTRREAMIKAAEVLIIGAVVLQKAVEKGLVEEGGELNSEKQAELIDTLINEELEIPEATESECLRYFTANPEQFKSSPLLEVSHILIASDPHDLEHRAESLLQAESILQLLKNRKESFETLARKYSSCPSKEIGGSLGQISHGQTVSEFERQVFAAEEGLIEQVIESRYGYHIVFIARKVEGSPLSYEIVKEKIKQYLNEKVYRKAVSQYLHRLISEADIKGFAFDFDDSMLMQ